MLSTSVRLGGTRFVIGQLAPTLRQTYRYQPVVRSFASYVDFDDDLDAWPRSQMNTVLNVCPQGEIMVVERLGKFHSLKAGGWFVAVPLVDNIR
jgi:hypothetical protein